MPEKVRGWQQVSSPGPSPKSVSVSVGEFLLKKGEMTDNGKFGIQFLDVQRTTACEGPIEGSMRPTGADFRFYRVSDGKTLQMLTNAFDGNSTQINGNEEIDYLGMLYIHALNTEDEWVWIEVYRYEYH